MLENLWFILQFIFISALFFAILHGIVTHFIVWYEMRNHRLMEDSSESIPLREIMKSLMIEIGCNFIRIFLIPFSWQTYQPQPQTPNAIPIILVHGYLQNQTDWLWVRKELQKIPDIGPIYTFNLQPALSSIQKLAESLQQKIEDVKQETNQKRVILIGHSMGGLVSSFYNEYLAKPNEIAMIISLGSPFRGTRLAALGIGQNAKEMSHNSKFLLELTNRMKLSETPYYFILSKIDNLIVPWQSAFPNHHEEKGQNIFILEDYGHLRLLISRKVIDQITTWVKNVA